jgi:hypothetical protein
MRRIRIATGTLALLALAASAVADAPNRAAAQSAAVCSITDAACPILCGPCPSPCPLPCAGEASAQDCAAMAVASR